MRIVNLEEFMKLPNNIVFMKYDPIIFENLMIKVDSNEIDFFYNDLTNIIDTDETLKKHGIDKTCQNNLDLLNFAEKSSCISLDLDFESVTRDGCFDEDQLFAVYEKNDIDTLIKKLKTCVGAGEIL